MIFNECGKSMIKGHLRIYEEESQKVLFDRHNDIHPENFSKALAQSLANESGFINELVFGNGGVRVNASSEFQYSSPQTFGVTASLYNQTYQKVVNPNSSDNVDITRNYINVSHVNGNVYSDILIHCTLEKNEPAHQNVMNNNNEITSEFSFSEVGLKTVDGDLITHICHYPIQKSLNTTLVFDYLIRIQIV